MAKEQKTETPQAASKLKSKEIKDNKPTFVFTKEKYLIMLGGVLLILLGFILMIGGGSEDPNEFSYELFSFQRLTLAPILVVAGFVVQVFAIMKKPKDTASDITKTE